MRPRLPFCPWIFGYIETLLLFTVFVMKKGVCGVEFPVYTTRNDEWIAAIETKLLFIEERVINNYPEVGKKLTIACPAWMHLFWLLFLPPQRNKSPRCSDFHWKFSFLSFFFVSFLFCSLPSFTLKIPTKVPSVPQCPRSWEFVIFPSRLQDI